jgi:hypothetical protein
MYLLSKSSSPSLTDTQTEFHDQDRIKLLTALKEALEAVNSSVPANIRDQLQQTMSHLSTLSSPSLTDPQTEFRDRDRIELLTALKKAIKVHVPSTVWASLWLSDFDKLKYFVDQACLGGNHLYGTRLALLNQETNKDIVLLCELISLYTFS